MLWLRSVTFHLYFMLWTVTVAIIGFPLFFAKPTICLYVGHIWARGSLAGLRFLCNIRWNIENAHYIPKDKAVIIASKHQSTWETLIYYLLFPTPVFVLKKELVSLPFFGMYLPRMGMIVLDREGKGKALKHLLKETKHRIHQGRSVVVFPEGTRAAPFASGTYQPGITALYHQSLADILPVALNAGLFWPKDSFLKKPGCITLRFLPTVEKDLPKEVFLAKLQESIESETRILEKKALFL